MAQPDEVYQQSYIAGTRMGKKIITYLTREFISKARFPVNYQTQYTERVYVMLS